MERVPFEVDWMLSLEVEIIIHTLGHYATSISFLAYVWNPSCGNSGPSKLLDKGTPRNSLPPKFFQATLASGRKDSVPIEEFPDD